MAEAFGPRVGQDSASTGRARGPLYDRPATTRSARLAASMVARNVPEDDGVVRLTSPQAWGNEADHLPRCLGGEVTFPSLPMAVELLARDARASVPCPRPSERVGLAQVARRASDPLAPRSAWSLAGNSRHAVGAACVLVLTSMSSAWPFHRKVRPLTAVAPCAARICMLSKAHMLISERPPAPHRS